MVSTATSNPAKPLGSRAVQFGCGEIDLNLSTQAMREWAQDCAVIIPCLNEAGAIGGLVRQVKEFLPSVVVVNDGSDDKTEECARAAGAQVISHATPQGKGAALKAGWLLAHRQGFTWALSLDGDGQHLPSEIPSFLASATQHRFELLIGNRMSNAKHMPWIRWLVNGWMSRQLSKAAGLPLPDSQCGYRLMHLDAWSRVELSAEHFEIESDVLAAFLSAGHRVGFIPIQTVYCGESSKIHPYSDTLRWFRWWRRTRRVLKATHLQAGSKLPGSLAAGIPAANP